MSASGIAAMVRAALWCERVLGLELLGIGREGLAPRESCVLEMCGRCLFYSILLDGGFVFLSAQPMDSGDSLEKLVTVGDCADGWRTVCRLVEALEHSGITSLHPRPLELGEMDPNGFVIE
jgi:hypothetical protein